MYIIILFLRVILLLLIKSCSKHNFIRRTGARHVHTGTCNKKYSTCKNVRITFTTCNTLTIF